MPSEPLIPPAWSREVIDAQLREIERRWARPLRGASVVFPVLSTALREETIATVALIEAVALPRVMLPAFDSEGATD